MALTTDRKQKTWKELSEIFMIISLGKRNGENSFFFPSLPYHLTQ